MLRILSILLYTLLQHRGHDLIVRPRVSSSRVVLILSEMLDDVIYRPEGHLPYFSEWAMRICGPRPLAETAVYTARCLTFLGANTAPTNTSMPLPFGCSRASRRWMVPSATNTCVHLEFTHVRIRILQLSVCVMTHATSTTLCDVCV